MALHRLGIALGVGVALVSTPVGVAYFRHELLAMAELESLGRRLPEKTAVLDTVTDVDRSNGECRALVAKVLGTELGVADLAAFVLADEPARAEATSVAWAVPGTFRHRGVAASDVDETPIPPAVEHQLSRWMSLPPGVRRVVLYRTRTLSAGADPRCL